MLFVGRLLADWLLISRLLFDLLAVGMLVHWLPGHLLVGWWLVGCLDGYMLAVLPIVLVSCSASHGACRSPLVTFTVVCRSTALAGVRCLGTRYPWCCSLQAAYLGQHDVWLLIGARADVLIG